MIISKCASNVSKNASQFASKTNWSRLGGVPSGPGAPRDNLSIPRPSWACTLAPWAMRPNKPSQTIMGLHVLAWVGPKAQGPHGHPWGGRYTREKARMGLASSPGCSPRVSSTRCSGTIRGSRRIITDFSDFLGRLHPRQT